MPDAADPLPPDLIAALEALQQAHPGSWHDIVADAVVAVGGTDAADLLALSADRAAAGIPRDGEDGDPEAALEAMEADLRALDGAIGSTEAKAIDLIAELPQLPPRPDDDGTPHRSMN